MSDLAIIAAIPMVVFTALKFMIWSGPYPPDSGWSQRQLKRMNAGKSPWTIWCALTYHSERHAEIKKASE